MRNFSGAKSRRRRLWWLCCKRIILLTRREEVQARGSKTEKYVTITQHCTCTLVPFLWFVSLFWHSWDFWLPFYGFWMEARRLLLVCFSDALSFLVIKEVDCVDVTPPTFQFIYRLCGDFFNSARFFCLLSVDFFRLYAYKRNTIINVSLRKRRITFIALHYFIENVT